MADAGSEAIHRVSGRKVIYKSNHNSDSQTAFYLHSQSEAMLGKSSLSPLHLDTTEDADGHHGDHRHRMRGPLI